jgi:hypothetical protein
LVPLFLYDRRIMAGTIENNSASDEVQGIIVRGLKELAGRQCCGGGIREVEG